MKRRSKQSKKRRDRKTSTRNYAEISRTPFAALQSDPASARRIVPIVESRDRFDPSFTAPQLGKR